MSASVEAMTNPPAATEGPQSPPRQQVQIDDSKASPLYANFCRVTGTPEELSQCLPRSDQARTLDGHAGGMGTVAGHEVRLCSEISPIQNAAKTATNGKS